MYLVCLIYYAQAFVFSGLDQEVSRGPVDFRRDWTDPDELTPRLVRLAVFVLVLSSFCDNVLICYFVLLNIIRTAMVENCQT